MRFENVIKGSLLSEKCYSLVDKKTYALKVDINATKLDIRSAVEQAFGVQVVSVNTSVLRGKVVRKSRSKKGGALSVKLPNVKKAYIRLKDGQELPVPAVAAGDASADEQG